MRLRHTILAVLLVFGLANFSPTTGLSQTRLGLHVTQEELNIWKQRAASGPYKSPGDVSANSPGDWTRIQNNANAFLSNPSAELWSGQNSSACWRSADAPPALPGRKRGELLRDAAFVYLVTGATTYRDAVRTQLLAQAATAGTNFADSVRWVASPSCTSGDSHSHEIAMWLTKLIFGYDYIRGSLTISDRTILDMWFRNAGLFWENVAGLTIKKLFPYRDKNDYTLNSAYLPDGNGGSSPRVTHFGGYTKRSFHEGWNNRIAQQVRIAALVGILTNDTFLKNQAKRWFKEWIKYHVFPDGTDADFNRWTDTRPGLGWHYAGSAMGTAITIADHLARTGDLELYQFSTSDGLFGTAGGPKSLQTVMIAHLGHVNYTRLSYGTNQSSLNGNSLYSIGSVDNLAKQSRVHDTYITPANVYFKNNFLKSIYMRTASGAPNYPSIPATSGEGSAWGGEWNVYPGVLFMFGQMEGKVWPYSGANGSVPTPASGLLVQPKLP